MDDDVKIDESYYSGGILEAGVDGVFRHNDKLFNEVKSGTWSQTFNTPNIDYKVGAVDGVLAAAVDVPTTTERSAPAMLDERFA